MEYKEAEQPTPAQIAQIEALANQCIAANLPVLILTMKRSEAEARFAAGVNGTGLLHLNTGIYDKFPVPEAVSELRILLIEDWNVNCTARNVVARFP